MNRTLLILSLVFLLPSLLPAQNKRAVKVYFTNKQTNEQSMTLKQNLNNRHNIQLDYNQWTFDEKGRLKELAFSVDCRDGFSGNVGLV